MPSYVSVRTIDDSRPDGGLVTKIEQSIANQLVSRAPGQYEIVAPVKVTVDPPNRKVKVESKSEPKPCVGCGK